MFGKVAVLVGDAADREIFGNLQKKGIELELIDLNTDYLTKLQQGNFARAFIALSGREAEEGRLQGLLECLNIPYTGSKILGSALAMDKVRSKRIWQGLGLATPPFAIWEPGTGPDDYVKLFGLPLCIKPALGSASIGVSRISSATNFDEACDVASQYGPVLIEPWLIGDEYTLCILGAQSLPAVQLDMGLSDEMQYICPSPLSYAEEENLKLLATQAFKAVGASDWGSVDFIRDLNGDYWILEVNTAPQITTNSLFLVAAKAAGLSADELVLEILSLTMGMTSKVQYAKT